MASAADKPTAQDIMRRIKSQLKIEAELSEPGYERWRVHKARAELLRELINEFWNV